LRRCTTAAQAEAVAGSASLDYQESQLRAGALEAMGRHREARLAYERAAACLERLRFRLRGDEIKIAFLKDKLSVYDNLFWLTLTDALPDRVKAAFRVAELAKSRSMAEQMRGPALADEEPAELLALRRDLDVVYQQIQREESGGRVPAQVAALRDQARRQEATLAGRLAGLNALRRANPAATADVWDADTLRSWLPGDTQLLEFFVSRGTLFVFLADRTQVRVWPLAPARRIQELVRILRFQLSPQGGSPAAVQGHLRHLHDELLAPVRPLLTGEHLAIVPHGILHGLPFAALHDGDGFLLDRYAISYAPSATLLRLTGQRPVGRGQGSLIAGVADENAPEVAVEAQRLAERLPDARLLAGADATSARLRDHMRTARIVHLAAHGYFQRENPLFSAIRLHDSWLTVFDLYRSHIVADLVTLSGCSTGVSEVVGADELVGLVRGLLQAGARSALVSLWDVHDGSTLRFMENFYDYWLSQKLDAAQALRRASLDLRMTYPDVYHWAAFSLIGLGRNR
jgi:CHAT domain-containing protein